MSKQKDLKRRIRARMGKTGESYTTARAHIVRKRRTPSLPDNYQQLAGKSDDLLTARTGRTWPEWVEALDAVGAVKMTHGEIARWVYDQSGLDWWSQTVAVGYERIRGLREVGQRRGGGYEASKSRTFAVPVSELFDAFVNDARRTQWLDESVTVRKATPHRTVRITWSDGTNVDVYLTAKGPSKSTVAIQHGKLPSKEAMDGAKASWKERLDALGRHLK